MFTRKLKLGHPKKKPIFFQDGISLQSIIQVANTWKNPEDNLDEFKISIAGENEGISYMDEKTGKTVTLLQ